MVFHSACDYISLVTNDVVHLFIWLLGNCISSIEKLLFKTFAHVLIGLFPFLYCRIYDVLYDVWIQVSYQIYHLLLSNILFHFRICLV